MVRPTILTLVMAGAFLAISVQVRLVAQQPTPEKRTPQPTIEPPAPGQPAPGQPAPGQPAPTEQQISQQKGLASRVTVQITSELSKKLSGEDSLTEQLRAVLQTESGALVLRDRAGYYEAAAREDARAEVVPEFFEELFQADGPALRLREGNLQFREQFLAASESLNRDLQLIKQTLAEKAERIEIDSDLSKLLRRFMTDDHAPIILYVRQLRPRMRPGVEVLERVFQDQFAKRSDGMYVIRPEAVARTSRRISVYDEKLKMLRRIEADLSDFADDMVPVDDFHQRFIAALKKPASATVLAMGLFNEDRVNRRMAEHISAQFEGGVREGPDGLLIRKEAMQHFQRVLPMLERTEQAMETIRPLLNRFVSMIAEDDQLHRDVKRVMRGEVMLARASSAAQYATGTIDAAVDMFFSSFLSEGEDGILRVDTSNVPEENLMNLVSSIFREARMARRRGREVSEFTERIADPNLRAAMMSPGGKVAIGQELQRRSNGTATNGLDHWLQEHFEVDGDRYVIRDDRRDTLSEFVRHVGEVRQELENADF